MGFWDKSLLIFKGLCDNDRQGVRRIALQSGIRKEDVNAALLLLPRGVQPIKVRKIRDVALNTGDVLADLLHGCIELALTATGNKNVRALYDESLRRGKADATVAIGEA
jgi:hypothetical protein